MIVNTFQENDLEAAGAMAQRLWEGEVEIPAGFALRLYAYLVRYYFRRDSAFNLACRDDDGKLSGFLLAAPAGTTRDAESDQWLTERLQNDAEKRLFAEYLRYLEYNRIREEQAAQPGDLLLLLFCSIRRGSGKMLLETMTGRARKAALRSFFLWTDESCDLDYYARHGFTAAAEFPGCTLCGTSFKTLLYRKMLHFTGCEKQNNGVY